MIGDHKLLAALRTTAHRYANATATVASVQRKHELDLAESRLVEDHERREYLRALQAYRESIPGYQGLGAVEKAMQIVDSLDGFARLGGMYSAAISAQNGAQLGAE